MPSAAQLHQLFQSDTLAALIRNARSLTSNPIILTDLAHNVLEMSHEPGLTDPKYLDILKTRRVSATDSVSNVYRRSMLLHKPLLNRDIEDSVDVMRMAVCHRDQLIGFIEIPCYHRIPDKDEQELIMFIADVACLIMKRDLGYLYAPSNEKDFFLSDLLEGRIRDENMCKARCGAIGWKIPEHFRVMTIMGKKNEAPFSKSRMAQRKKEIEAQFPDIAIFLYGEALKLIVPTREDTALDGKFFFDMINYLKEHQLEAGISRSARLLTDIAECNAASEKALEAGQILRSDEIIFFYDKYSIYHALEICEEHAPVMQFCHSAIIRLADYDRTHGTSLLDTLRAYLYTRQNVAASSELLFVHRNTLNHRLQKIDDLIHVDLTDSENIFHLMLSFHILEYLGANKIHDYESRIRLNPLLKHQ